MTTTTNGQHDSYSSWDTITTTAVREIQVIAKTKAVITSVAILLIVMLGLIAFGTWQSNKDEDSANDVAVVGMEASAFEATNLDGRDVADRAEAEQLVRDGDVEAAVVADGDNWEVIFDGLPDMQIMSTVSQLSEMTAQSQAISQLGIDPAEYANATPNISVEPVDVRGEADPEADFMRLFTAFIALAVIVFTVILFAANVGGRVTEEKSSRVVELILATVRPMDFLAGKILANLVFGFVATTLVLGVGAVGLTLSGLLEDMEFDWSILPIFLLSWLLAMLFFSGLYAAAGAMVQRTEDLQSTQMPILIIIMISAYIPMFGWTQTDTTWMQVVSWIPPMSIFAAPLTYVAGNFTAIQLAVSLAIAFAATIAVTWFAARVYRRTILNNGKTAKWSEALKG